jgi:diaminopimelate decarboxylase
VTWQDIILPLALAVIAASPGLVALFRGRKKEQADVAEAITRAAGELVEDYQKKLERIEKKLEDQAELIRCQEQKIDSQAEKLARQGIKIDEQAARIRGLELERDDVLTGVMMLCTQIHDLGHDPVWEPELPEER